MSEESSFEDFGDEADFSLNVSASTDESTDTEAHLFIPDSTYVVQDKSTMKKEIGDNSTSSFIKETIDVFEVEDAEQDATESKPVNDSEKTSTPTQQYLAEVAKTSGWISLEKETGGDLLRDKQNETEDESFSNAEPSTSFSSKSPTTPSDCVIFNSSKSSINTSVEDSIVDDAVEQDATRSKPEASGHAEQSASNKSPLSPTSAMKVLSISDSPKPGKKGTTPRQSRFRAGTMNIFDSPYNTRLKARMIRERETRSRSEGRKTNE